MDEEQRESGPDYDPRQHAMLMYCACKGDMFLWNDWRQSHPAIKIWLEGADLQRAELRGANLQGVYLWQANLQKTDLWDANLQGAKMGLVPSNHQNCSYEITP